VLKRGRRGRPRQREEPPRAIRHSIELRIGAQRKDVIQQEKERLSTFVLITNVPLQDRSAEDVLCDYHSQFLAETGVTSRCRGTSRPSSSCCPGASRPSPTSCSSP